MRAVRTPGPLVEATVPPLSASLLKDYCRWTRARDDGATVPPHLFPQWSFPPMIEALSGLPFSSWRALRLAPLRPFLHGRS